jgi:hypothetical protein
MAGGILHRIIKDVVGSHFTCQTYIFSIILQREIIYKVINHIFILQELNPKSKRKKKNWAMFLSFYVQTNHQKYFSRNDF